MFFRQLFDRESCTYTYLLADDKTREAVLIDPVLELVDRDVELIEQLGFRLVFSVETHIHADHVTGSGSIRDRLGCQTVVGAHSGADCADLQAAAGDLIRFGRHELEVRATPGHTGSCVSYVQHDSRMVFTGDALMVRGCGRTDFQEGNARTLYRSVHGALFILPDDFTVYPAHDYKGRTASTIGEEKQFNPRLGGGVTEDEFVQIMADLELGLPKKMHEAVPANRACGMVPS